MEAKSRFGFFKRLWMRSPFLTSVAIDIDSISNISIGGEEKPPKFWLKFFRETGFLVYKRNKITDFGGNDPIVLNKNIFRKVRIFNVDAITEDERKMILSKLKKMEE